MKIIIKTESIRVGQLLKKMNIISTGGEAKIFLENNIVKVNDRIVGGRGASVFVGAKLQINNDIYNVVSK